MARTKGGYTVDGVERSYPEIGAAVSRSITAACASKIDATFYVRNEAGDIVGRSESVGREVYTYVKQ